MDRNSISSALADDKNVTRSGASEYLAEKYGLIRSYATLAKYAVHGGGPAFFKVGPRSVLYSTAELDRWVASITTRRRSTSEACSRVAA